MTRPRNTPWRIFAAPLAIALASLAGLAAGLAGDGGWDAVAAVGLAVPVLACAPAWRRRRTVQRRSVPSSDPGMPRRFRQPRTEIRRPDSQEP